MNAVDRWFAALATKKLRRGAHRSVNGFAADIEAWTANWNEDPKLLVGHEPADEILERLAGYCSTVNELLSAPSRQAASYPQICLVGGFRALIWRAF